MADNTFAYTDFTIQDDGRTVHFGYRTEQANESFELTEILTFPQELTATPAIQAGLRALHLALGVSYYKIFASPVITYPYAMTQDEADFWNDVWRNGLGEYLYINQLSPDILARFNAQDGTVHPADNHAALEQAAILGIGGGKDSVVAGEVLKAAGIPVEGFVMATGEQRGQAQAVAETMQVPLQAIERRLDPQLLTLQERPDAYKGHVPISLIFGLVGTVLALAASKAYVVVANEASASIPRVTWEHGAVNHQWSKSFGFEQRLQRYIHDVISDRLTYFSAIRPLTSVAVTKLFARYPQYFEVFTSDNYVFRIDPARRPNARWSLESPKSLSSFMLLAPWLSDADMLRTFGRNFLDEASLTELFERLVGLAGEPPLDCVGTVEELVLSLNLAYDQGKFQDSELMRLAAERGIITDADHQMELLGMLSLQPEQAFPTALQEILLTNLEQSLV